jgi:C1A family cysteine protease
MTRKFPVRKDAFDARDHLAMRSLAPLPSSIDLSAKLGPVRDQGASGSCTGQAGAGFMDWLYNTMTQYFPQKISPVEFSALFLYARERIANGDFPADEGSDSRTLMWVLNTQGICPDADDPFVDTEIAQMPTSTMGSQAIPFKIGAYHRVLFDAGLETSRSVLASGYCHVIGIPVYAAIQSEQVAETGLLPIPGTTETAIGGHEMLVYGYDDAEQVHLVRNSWSITWGLSGNLKIPYGYYAAVGGNDYADAWVGHLGKPW